MLSDYLTGKSLLTFSACYQHISDSRENSIYLDFRSEPGFNVEPACRQAGVSRKTYNLFDQFPKKP